MIAMTERRRPKPSAYHLMSKQEKEAYANHQVRESPVRCRNCSTQVMPADLISHMQTRCTGRADPGPGAKWIGWREAVEIIRRATPGMSEPAAMMRLSRWSRPDQSDRVAVRARGERGDRKYLHGDLVDHIEKSGLVVVGTNKNVSEEPCP